MEKLSFFLALIFVNFLVSTSRAGLILTLDDLSTTEVDVIIVDDVDGGIGTSTPFGLANSADLSLGDGVITFANNVGAFVINLTVGQSRVNDDNLLALASFNVSGLSSGSLEVMLTDTDFTVPADNVTLDATIFGATQGSLAWTEYLDTKNQAFGTEYGIGGQFTDGGFFAASQSSGPIELDGPFSLTKSIILTHTGGLQASTFGFLGSTSSVPEPASMTVWSVLGAALAAGVVRRRRRGQANGQQSV